MALLLATLLPSICLAGSLQTWNDLRYTVVRSGHFEWQIEGTHRFAETVGNLYDQRLGTRFQSEIAKGVKVGAGYLVRKRKEDGASFNDSRMVAGISYPIVRGDLVLEGATGYERHFVPASDFNRLQQRLELFQDHKTLSPWLYQLFTFKQGAGFVRSRSRLGFRWHGSRYSFKAAYQFESGFNGAAWEPRHAIYTEIGIDRPLWLHE